MTTLVRISMIIVLAVLCYMFLIGCNPEANKPSENSIDSSSTNSTVKEQPKSPQPITVIAGPEIEIIAATDLTKLGQSFKKEVGVEGAVTDLNKIYDAVNGKYLILYFGNTYEQHITDVSSLSLKGNTISINTEFGARTKEVGTDFRVIIKEDDLGYFPNICYYINRKIRVTGTVDLFNGAPVIRVTGPEQIEYIDDPPMAPVRESVLITVSNSLEQRSYSDVRFRRSIVVTNTNTDWAIKDVCYGTRKVILFIPPYNYTYNCSGSTPVYQTEVSPYSVTATVDFTDQIKDQDIVSQLTWKWVWMPSKPQL